MKKHVLLIFLVLVGYKELLQASPITRDKKKQIQGAWCYLKLCQTLREKIGRRKGYKEFVHALKDTTGDKYFQQRNRLISSTLFALENKPTRREVLRRNLLELKK